MASGNIRGLTIEIGGDTTGLEQALGRVNTESKSLQNELKAVERGLKFDPGNVELVRQRQELLTQSISDTSQRLDILRTAQAQVQRQYDAGEIPVEQYRSFQRELQVTEGNLNRLQNSLSSIDAEQDRLGESTRALGTLFDATGTNVNDFASALGSRLTSAIRDGSASADQLDRAIRIVGQQALGASTDVDQLRTALRQIDDGGSIQDVRRELSQVANEANEAGDAVNGFGDQLTQVAGGLAAGGGIASIISQALDISSLDTKIDITLDVPEESRESVRQAIVGLQAYGVEGEEALEGVRRQFVLNKDATDEANAATVRYAGAIANAYSDIDFKELIQETNEISSIFGITADESLGLVNNLLRVGFPPDQLDIISEYGDQLIRAGYSAEEIQQIFAAGVDTGTYNIDQLLDGLKEGRIVLSEFGAGVDDATAELISNVGISTQQLQTWGAAVAGGGEAGKAAFEEAAQAVVGIDDAVQRNAVGVALFGTLYEEQGDKITSTILNASDQVVSLDANQQALNQTVDGLDASPAVLLSTAFTDLQTALKPLLDFVAQLIADFAKFASENVTLVAAITAIGTVVGILAGAFVLLAPALGGIVTALPVLTTAFAAITAPIALTVAAIVGLGAAFIALYQNSETFRDNVNAVFEKIREVAETVFQAIADFIGQQLQKIQDFWATNGEQILQAAENVFNGIMAVVDFVFPAIQFVVETVWNAIKDVISGSLDIILGLVKVFAGVFTGDFSKIWEGVKQIFKGAIDLILGLMTLTFFGGIRTTLANLAKSMSTTISGAWTSVRGFFSGSISSITGFINGFRTTIGNQFNSIKNIIVDTIKSTNLFQVGKDIINGLIRGISSLAGKVKETVTGIVNGIKDRITDALKIKSPSRVTMGYGENIGEGLEIGIDSTRNDVFASSKRLADSVINAQSSLNGSAIQSDNNQVARTTAAQSNSIDMDSLVAAIGNLASRPIQTAVQLNGQTIATSTSQYQNSNYNVAALQKGVTR